MFKATDIHPPPTGPLLRFTAGRMVWPALLIPLVMPAVLALYSRFIAPLPDKDYAEAGALLVMGVAVGIAALRWIRQRHPYWLWLACLATSLLFREIHISNTSVGADIIALCLLLYAWRYYPRFAGYLAGRSTVTLLNMALLSYALAVAFDQGLLDALSTSYFLPFLVEEYIEMLGHGFMLLLTLYSHSDYNPLLDQAANNA